MTPGGGEILFESRGLRATFRSAGAPERPLVVTFDALSTDLRLERPGFGEAWLAHGGYDAVHVVAARNDWYRDADMPALLARLRERGAERARVVTYGSSMGGYAAVRFAGRLGAHAAVAISPQVGIDPVSAPWETRWTEYALGWTDPAYEAGGDGAAPESVFAIYDPTNRDRLHAEALARHHRVVHAPVPHAGHPAGAFLAETGLLSGTVRAMIDDRFDPRLFRSQVRAARRRSAAYHVSLAAVQPARRGALALRLAEEAVRLSPATAAYQSALGEQRGRAGDLAGAQAALRRACELDPREPKVRLRLAEHLALNGGDAREVEALVRGLEAAGGVREWLFVRACDLLFAVGAFRSACEEARAASRRLPASRALRLRAWSLGAALAAPLVGPALLRALRPALVRARLRRGEEGSGRKRLVGATGFEPATP